VDINQVEDINVEMDDDNGDGPTMKWMMITVIVRIIKYIIV